MARAPQPQSEPVETFVSVRLFEAALGELKDAMASQAQFMGELAEIVRARSITPEETVTVALGLGEGKSSLDHLRPLFGTEAAKVGDSVHFYTVELARQVKGMGIGPYAALVARADGDRLDLYVLNPQRGPFPVYSVLPGSVAKNLPKVNSEDEVSQWWEPRG